MTITIYLFFFVSAFTCLVFTNEIIYRIFKPPQELMRKISHSASCLISALFPFFINQTEVILLTIFFMAIFIFNLKFRFFTHLKNLYRRSIGEIFLVLGIALTFAMNQIVDNNFAYIFAMMVIGLSDSLAALSRKKGKSVLGSSIFLIVTVLVLFGLNYFGPNQISISLIAIIAVLLTILEYFSTFGLDNLSLPFIGYVLYYYATSGLIQI
jgi:phytol kinase